MLGDVVHDVNQCKHARQNFFCTPISSERFIQSQRRRQEHDGRRPGFVSIKVHKRDAKKTLVVRAFQAGGAAIARCFIYMASARERSLMGAIRFARLHCGRNFGGAKRSFFHCIVDQIKR
jgi:hypothetical protein